MLSGVLERKLRKLNKDIRIFCGNDDRLPAGVFIFRGGEYETICAADKNWVPEHIVWNENGTMFKGGWRRILKILIKMQLIDRWEAQKEFSTHLEYASRRPTRSVYKPKRKLIEKYAVPGGTL